MRFVVTVRRGRELRSQTCLSAREAFAFLNSMRDEGFALASLIDRTYCPITEIDLSRAVLIETGALAYTASKGGCGRDAA